MGSKYKLLENECVVLEDGRKLYRIQALKSFGDVKIGDKGGFIELEDNLSHEGDCWVYGSACVMNNGKITENGKIADYVLVYGNGKVYGNAEVTGKCSIHENGEVYGDAKLSGIIDVCGEAHIHGDLNTCGSFVFAGNADVYENRHYFVGYPMTIRIEKEEYESDERGFVIPIFFRSADNEVLIVNTLSEDESVLCTPVHELLELLDTEEYAETVKEMKHVIADLCAIALSYIKLD